MAKKEARTRRIAPPPAHAAARCAAGHPEYADSRKKDLFPQVKGKRQVCDRGANGQRSLWPPRHRVLVRQAPTLPRDLRSPLTLDDDLACCPVGPGEPINILAHATVAWRSWWAVTAMGE